MGRDKLIEALSVLNETAERVQMHLAYITGMDLGPAAKREPEEVGHVGN